MVPNLHKQFPRSTYPSEQIVRRFLVSLRRRNSHSTMDSNTKNLKSEIANMRYTNCKTRIVDLRDFNIPDSATESEYRELYNSIKKSKLSSARAFTDAVASISVGIAPPVAFPTETVYGLGADATSQSSIAGIFAAKGRPSDNPLIVHTASKDHLERITGEIIPKVYHDLVKDHWPGPLTILVPVPASSVFAQNVHPGQKTIGFRVPESKYARFFIAATGKPIAAPSANSSGKPSPTTARHVLEDMNGKINFILDGGSCDVGVESTVVDGLHSPPLILRPGGLSQDDLIAHGRKYDNVWKDVQIGYKQSHSLEPDKPITQQAEPEEAPRAPGMKYKHYAPQGQMILYQGLMNSTDICSELDRMLKEYEHDTLQSSSTTALNGLLQTPQEAKINVQRVKAPPANDSAFLSERKLVAAIITTTSWPTDLFPINNDSQQDDTRDRTNGLEAQTHLEFHAPLAELAVSTSSYGRHTVHIISLGCEPKAIAQSLFAALRLCDELGCQFILAEAPQRQSLVITNGDHYTNGVHEADTNPASEVEKDAQKHEFDAVMERMKKAASKLVQAGSINTRLR